MTNLLAMTTVQWVGVAMLIAFGLITLVTTIALLSESRHEWILWMLAALLACGLHFVLTGCKPIDHQPEQSPEPTPTMVACVTDEDVTDDVLTRTCWYADGPRTFELPVEELRP